MLYQIQASAILERKDGWRVATQLPTFYLEGATQGIVSVEHAANIAHEVIDPLDLYTEVHLTVLDSAGNYHSR